MLRNFKNITKLSEKFLLFNVVSYSTLTLCLVVGLFTQVTLEFTFATPQLGQSLSVPVAEDKRSHPGTGKPRMCASECQDLEQWNIE